tara:strand:+ start:110 stop:862 length:753 start_codon:yes stop_codon:yes gene_type:complete
MDIYYISDLHLEFDKNYKKSIDELFGNIDDEVIMIIAGDVCSFDYFERYQYFIKYISRFEHVLIVIGNHEYYNSKNIDMDDIEYCINEEIKLYQNIHLLNNNTIEIGGYYFIGTTLWSKTYDKKGKINDYRKIYFDGKLLTTNKTNELHNDAVNFLEKEIKNDNINKIIITHHLPSYELIHSEYRTIQMKRIHDYFYTDLEYLMDDIKYWICGHTHKKMKRKIKNCNLLTNPLGYPNENKDIIVEKILFL